MPYYFQKFVSFYKHCEKKIIFRIHGAHHPANRDTGMQVQGVPAYIGANHARGGALLWQAPFSAKLVGPVYQLLSSTHVIRTLLLCASLVFKHRAKHTCEPCGRSSCEIFFFLYIFRGFCVY
jgi:hypothetical protein